MPTTPCFLFAEAHPFPSSRMSLSRSAVRLCGLYRIIKSKQASPSQPLRESPRSFSTDAEQPQDPFPAAQPPTESPPAGQSPVDSAPGNPSPSDPFFQDPGTDLTYGRLYGISKYTLRTDIVKLLEGCISSQQDVRVEYNRSYAPVNMTVQFPSWNAYDAAFKILARKGRLYRLEKANRSMWDILKPYNGKFVSDFLNSLQ